MDLKKPLSFNEQLNRLKSEGDIIYDDEKSISILKEINYYRFTGYALQFRIDLEQRVYKEGTIFERIYNLYVADEN